MPELSTLDAAGRAMGAALLHSVWQGLLVGGLAGCALRALRDASAQARYVAACLSLAGLLGAFATTAIRTAAPLLAAPESSTTPPALSAPPLGPGLFDFSPAVREIAPLDTARDAQPPSLLSRVERWSVAAVPVWFAGVVLLSFRLAVSWVGIERLRRTGLAPTDLDLSARVTALARRLHISRPVRVAHAAGVHVPAVVGWLRPVLLVPVSAVSGLSPAQLDAIIAHELAHVRRHDYAVNVLQSIADTLLFYHPACWWLSRRIRIEREHCCDDLAVAVCGDRLAYAAALADLEALRQRPALALASTDGALLQRVRRLVAPPERGAPAWAAFALPLAVLAIVIGGTPVTRAQQSPEQVRVPGMGRTVPGGRGIVGGQVVEVGTGRPIAGARVEVRGSADQVVVTTDQTGRYETRPLAPGLYSVLATAPGHALSSYAGRAATVTGQSIEAEGSVSGPTAGASRIAIANFVVRTSVRVDVRSGALVTDIDIAMQPTGHVSGRILDDRGRGLAGAYIELRAATVPPTGAYHTGVAYAQSAADGGFRLTAPPGDYTLRAYVGRHVRPSRDAARAYVATYYPAVPLRDAAQLIRVNAGVELFDVDFPLVSSATARVAGTVVDPARDALDGVRVTLRGVPSASGEQGVTLDLNARGEFDVRDVPLGTYDLMVTDPLRPSRWKQARRQFDITGDVTDLEIRASTAVSVSGRLVRDSRSTGDVNVSQVMVGFFIKAHDGVNLTMGSFEIAPAGSFKGEVPAGPVMLSVGGPRDWRVRSILVDGVESFGLPIDMTPGTHDIEVVLTDRHNSVEGVVVDRRGNPLGGFDVVLFSPDATRWYAMSPFVRHTRSHQNGRFESGSLPPGDYLVVATEGVPLLMTGDPEPTLERLRSIATRLTVRDGEHKTISIRASPSPLAP